MDQELQIKLARRLLSSNSSAQDESNKPVKKRVPGDLPKKDLSIIQTLDNPKVLEQQLEALEHHKKVLERREQYQKLIHDRASSSNQPLNQRLTSTNSLNRNTCDQHNNVKQQNNSNVIYSNLLNDAKGGIQPTINADLAERFAREDNADLYEKSIPNNAVEFATLQDDMEKKYYMMELQNEANIGQYPPSPVSSSYSELIRSNMDSTYESIYEPINPRPPSQMSNYSGYATYVNVKYDPDSKAKKITHNLSHLKNADSGIIHNRHEQNEIDALTDLLVQSLDVQSNRKGQQEAECSNYDAGTENFGTCVRCNERVIGEQSGCTAMDQVYHISCFTCYRCQINLQGKSFYALDGQPCCEYDFLNTLEKCSVCMKPILDRILRATGKPYHPNCFCCVACGKGLDGIPFTVDAKNQNYCIEDFHKEYAPRCYVCHQPIIPENNMQETVRVVALDKSFHLHCYKCEDCGLLLSNGDDGNGCFPLDDHILCKSCNADRVQRLTRHMTTDL